MTNFKDKINTSLGWLQICADHDRGAKQLFMSRKELLSKMNAVNAENTLNSVNRNVFLHNKKLIFPSLSAYVHICCSSTVCLFVVSSTELKSSKGTTQGAPTAIVSYAIPVIPMIPMLAETEIFLTITQTSWYISMICQWLDELNCYKFSRTTLTS